MGFWVKIIIKRFVYLNVFCGLFVTNCFASSINGLTASTAFTKVGMARNVTTAGIYYFNLNGQAFSTHVNADGQLLIAIDFGNGTGVMPATSALTNIARGIVPVAVLSELTNLTEVRMTSSDGIVDVVTSNLAILNRIATNYQLNRGKLDDAYQSGWTGTGQTYVDNSNTYCNSSGPYTDLSERIFHPCGDANSFNWMSRDNIQRSIWSSGEIASTEYLQLLVGAAFVPLTPSLIVEKQADKTVNVAAGEVITYTYVMTNSGGTDLSDVKLVDVHNAYGAAPVPNPDTAVLTDVFPSGDSSNSLTGDNDWDVLGPGDSLTATATYTVTQSDLDNLQ